MDGPRIIVVGVTGSGKSTLARQLAERYGVPHVELDAHNWEANWVQGAHRSISRKGGRRDGGGRMGDRRQLL